jgi:hypothetical protein
MSKDAVPEAARLLANLFEQSQNRGGRIRVEDALSAGAAVTGEACIRALGEFDPEDHTFAPGSAVLSDRMNGLLCGEQLNWEACPDTSVFGALYRGALASGYESTDFPVDAKAVFTVYVDGIGRGDAQAEWGRPALSVGPEHRPFLPPIRTAYELRAQASATFDQRGIAIDARPTICAIAVALVLGDVKSAIEHRAAISLSLETINGMSKMAPMTLAYIQDAQLKKAPADRQPKARGLSGVLKSLFDRKT